MRNGRIAFAAVAVEQSRGTDGRRTRCADPI